VWTKGEIRAVGPDIKKQQANLRKKMLLHKTSNAHLYMERIIHQSKFYDILEDIKKLSKNQIETTENVFRTYCIAKNQCPFSDHPKLIDLQIYNGLNMRRILQSDKSFSNIIVDHIAIEMRKKVCSEIIHQQKKLRIIVDESTTPSKKKLC